MSGIIEIIVVVVVGGFLIGRGLIGFILNRIFYPNNEEPNPENWLGWIGSIIGMIITFFIYRLF